MIPASAILVYAADGLGMRDELLALIKAQLTEYPLKVVDDRARIDAKQMPDTWDNCAIVVLLTPGAFSDQKLSEFVNQAAAIQLPILPVVDDLTKFSFGAVPPTLKLSRLNAKGLRPDNGRGLIAALSQIFGFESRARMLKVFISYRRSDAMGAAEEINEFLWKNYCSAFLDTLDIAGGEPVQDVIMETLQDKDFVLFIDSPDAPNSGWIVEELNHALQRRIPVAVVRTDPPQQHLSLLGSISMTDWHPADAARLEKVLILVNRVIGGRDSLDGRITRTLANLARIRGLDVTPHQEPRRFEVRRSGQTILRLEYENSALSLERLHRLYQWYQSSPTCPAVFVGGDEPVLQPTRDAITWARQSLPLNALTVVEMVALLETL